MRTIEYKGKEYSEYNYYLINNFLIHHNFNEKPNKVVVENGMVVMLFSQDKIFTIGFSEI